MPETDSDIGAETARFQAFKDRSDDLPPAWQMKASGSKIGMFAVVVIVVAILAAIIGVLLVG
ncbi:MAG TPA: hypothetical protein VHT26_24715 [Trebonia sp.]|jgi:hypothetical protein|nr:hypothetical protein [Trebonia sp.]